MRSISLRRMSTSFAAALCTGLLLVLAACAAPPRVDTPSAQSRDPAHSVVPPEGFVPDGATAVRIAEAVLLPVYGEEVIGGQKPFRAMLRDGVWIVEGTLPPSTVGGVAHVELARSDGRILRMTRSR